MGIEKLGFFLLNISKCVSNTLLKDKRLKDADEKSNWPHMTLQPCIHYIGRQSSKDIQFEICLTVNEALQQGIRFKSADQSLSPLTQANIGNCYSHCAKYQNRIGLPDILCW